MPCSFTHTEKNNRRKEKKTKYSGGYFWMLVLRAILTIFLFLPIFWTLNNTDMYILLLMFLCFLSNHKKVIKNERIFIQN